MRSHRSSVWPIPFFEQLLTSQSGTVAGPREESSPHGTEAICLCNGPAGRSHTLAQERGKQGGGADRGRKGDRKKNYFHMLECISLAFTFILIDVMVYITLTCQEEMYKMHFFYLINVF